MNHDNHNPLHLSKHRVEALVDGIFAVAMTLLVIELRIPEHAHITSQSALMETVLGMFPKFISWLISFLVLAIFWVSHHRILSFVREIDDRLLWIIIVFLAGAALLPFTSDLDAEYASVFSQVLYSGDMTLMSAALLWCASYVHRHPQLCHSPLPRGVYRACVLRTIGLIAMAALAIPISRANAGMGNSVFLLMFPLARLIGRIQKRQMAPSLAAPQSDQTTPAAR